MKSLKTLAAFFFAAAVMTLTGCSKDPEDLIIGTWNATKVISTYSYTMGDHTETETETDTYKAGESQMTFKEDGTIIIKSTEDNTTSEESGTYTINDKKITITAEGQSMTGDIVNNDKKEMELKFNLSIQGMNMTADMFFTKA